MPAESSRRTRSKAADQVGDPQLFMEVEIQRGLSRHLDQYQQIPAPAPAVAASLPRQPMGYPTLRLRSSQSKLLEKERQARMYGVDQEFRRRDREQLAEDRSRSGTAPPGTEYESSSGSDGSTESGTGDEGNPGQEQGQGQEDEDDDDDEDYVPAKKEGKKNRRD